MRYRLLFGATALAAVVGAGAYQLAIAPNAAAQDPAAVPRGPPPGGPRPMSVNTPDVNIRFGSISTAAADALCAAKARYDKLLCLSDGLTKSLSPELKAKTLLPYSFENASKWSNFPPAGYRDRIGPVMSDFNPAQLGFVKAILTQAASMTADEGIDEIEQVLNADDYLKIKSENGGGGFSSGNYHFAFLGAPASTGTWQLYFGGHHFAFANTYKDGVLTGAAPSFRGVEPFFEFSQNGRDNAPMVQETAAFSKMLTSLTPAQISKAKLGKTYTDIIVGPQRDNTFPGTREGLRGADLTSAQKAAVLAAIETYVGDIAKPDADAIMARYRREIDDTFIAFAGTTGMVTEHDYVRIDGPSVWIECSMQGGRSIPGVHPHSVWRDRVADYGGLKPTT